MYSIVHVVQGSKLHIGDMILVIYIWGEYILNDTLENLGD